MHGVTAGSSPRQEECREIEPTSSPEKGALAAHATQRPPALGRWAAIAAIAAAVACSADPFSTNGSTLRLIKHSGDHQVATVAQGLAVPSVLVSDANGRAVSGIKVTFSNALNSWLSADEQRSVVSTLSGADGVATMPGSWLVLAGGPGAVAITATITGTQTYVTFNSTVVLFLGWQVQINDGNNQSAVNGRAVAIPPSARVVTGAALWPNSGIAGVPVTFTVAGGGGSISGATAVTDSNGVARVGSWTLGAGTNLLSAASSAPQITGGPVSYAATGTSSGGSFSTGAHLAAGFQTTCALDNSGALFCWGGGYNFGVDGTTVSHSAPVSISAPTFAAISGGSIYRCGLTSAGAAYCWGDNLFGDVGDGTSTPRVSPTAVIQGPLAFAAVAVGGHLCGLSSDSSAYCWGYNRDGGLGDGTTTDRLTPVALASGIAFKSLAAGGNLTCGLTATGTLYCWGALPAGGNALTPTLVPAPAFASVVVGGAHLCGLTSAGAAYCWGDSGSGQVGDGTYYHHPAPTAVAQGNLVFTSLTAGGSVDATCGLTSTGAAYCWGYGALGDNQGGTRSTPSLVLGGLTFTQLTLGYDHVCGIATDQVTYCWGSNAYGQLGDGTTIERYTPVAVMHP